MGLPSLNSKWDPFVIHPVPFPARIVCELRFLAEAGVDRSRIKHPIHMAIRWRKMMEGEEQLTMAGIAQKEGISGARVYQVMNFLKMTEDVQTYLRNINDYREAQYLNEKRLRHILYLGCEAEKVEAFRAVVSQLGR